MADFDVEFPSPCDADWNGMARVGQNRHCARCDKMIHQLSLYTSDEAQSLLQSGEAVCARAQLDGKGRVIWASRRRSPVRRIFAALVASISLAAMTTPSFAAEKAAHGVIAGTATDARVGTTVTAKDASGRLFSARVKRNGGYRIKHLPSGTYALVFDGGTDDRWEVENVVVTDRKTTTVDTNNPHVEYIVGVFERRRR